jgi:uncharacterized protein (DUF1786 family)
LLILAITIAKANDIIISEGGMRLLALDIGGLTQDMLLFDTSQTVENCVKMVMPSPTITLANKIIAATEAKRSLFLTGVNMGGGPSKRALINHLKAGLKVYATALYTHQLAAKRLRLLKS